MSLDASTLYSDQSRHRRAHVARLGRGQSIYGISVADGIAVPEPTTWAMMIGGIGIGRRRAAPLAPAQAGARATA